ncbi:hypothetical protein O0L34_g10765 [Tuta absoluta]|nr:hypothetical protein O0L34_g10765 [Tuta absoluta]
MTGTCITCLATRNLVDLGELEWETFDILLHPVSKQFPDIRRNKLARLCLSCQSGMGYVAKFRLSAVNKFTFLMTIWNVPPSMNIDTDPLNTEPVAFTPNDFDNQCLPEITNSNINETVLSLSHALKEEKKEKADETEGEKELEVPLKEEVPSENEEEETVEKHATQEYIQLPVEAIKIEVEAQNEDNKIKREDIDDGINSCLDDGVMESDRKNDTPYEKPCNISQPNVHARKKRRRNKDGHKCSHCSKSFKTYLYKQKHEEIKHGNLPPVTCTVCRKTIKNKHSLYHHMKFVHTDKTVHCDVCNKWYSRASYRQHFKSSSKHQESYVKKSNKYQCRFCTKYYRSNTDREEHEIIRHSNLPAVPCKLCNRTLLNKYSLDKHMRAVHLHEYSELHCKPCDKWFSNNYSYKRHLRVSPKHIKEEDIEARKVSCTICNKVLSGKKYLKNHMELHNDAVYCQPCGKWFGKTTYKKHITTSLKHNTRNEDKLFTCDDCKLQYYRKPDLIDHILTRHLKIPYQCGKCPLKFKSRRTRSRHMMTHKPPKEGAEEQRVCLVCGNTFKNAKTLKNHERIHTGERPFKCKMCDATFTHDATLYQHKKYVHEGKKNPYNEKKKLTAKKSVDIDM